ncbi:hypothetical protein MKY64_30250 [Paenibacillus sp. FSL R7-0210]|uniref:hypothetical protein n=1 Tax=Paenibacillus sp. FSL R7-0210 TaxID=2921676 RepID=UPI0030F4E1D2
MSELNPYESMIKFGRILVGAPNVDMAEQKPELIIQFVKLVEKDLLFKPIDDFFLLFPPIKRYEDDGMWDYFSTQEMRVNKLGTHFGKGDLAHLLMTRCYENKYIIELGHALISAISNIHEDQTGRSLAMDIFEQNGVKFTFVPD